MFRLILLILLVISDSSSETELRLPVFLSLHTVHNATSHLPAVSLAFKVANNRSDLLPGYKLTYSFRDVNCTSLRAIREVVGALEENTTFVMVLGADCSISSRALAAVTQYYNLVQISPGSTDAVLSEQAQYPLFLRTVPSDAFVASFIAVVMQWFGWQRVAVITEQDSLFTQTLEILQSTLPGVQARIIHQQQFTRSSNRTVTLNTLRSVVSNLLQSPARVVYLNMHQPGARDILCLAWEKGVTFPRFVWLVNGWYPDQWWEGLKGTCNDSDVEQILERSLVINHFPYLSSQTVTTDPGLSLQEYEQLYMREFMDIFGSDNLFAYSSSLGAFAFDAVWTAMLALNSSLGMSTEDGVKLDNLTMFNYREEGIGKLFYSSAIRTKFLGLTGTVQFDRQGDRSPDLRIMQYRFNRSNLSPVVIVVKSSENLMFVEGESNSTVFPGGVPADEMEWNISLGLFIFCTIFSAFGVALAIGFIVFNLVFKNHYGVKLSSPYINVLIGVGGVLLYCEAIIFGIDKGVTTPVVTSAMCRVQIWFASFAFTLVFGSILVKTWRIYYIFRNIDTRVKKKKPMKDIHLFVAIGVLLLVDLIFLSIISGLPQTRVHLETKELPSTPGSVPTVIGVCYTDRSAIWVSILLAYKGVLLIVGAILAFETRKVKIPELNESIYVAISIYTFFLISACLTLIGFLLVDMINVRYALIGIFTNVGTTVILCIVFVPKIITVVKDPKGENFSFNKPQATSTALNSTPSELRNEINKLKAQLDQIKASQADLTVTETTPGTVPADKEGSSINASQTEL